MQSVGDWYLIANQNDLAVRILGAITVGETADGELVIDSRDAAERWVTLTVDDAEQLVISYQQQRCILESPGKWVTHDAGLAVPKCTLFELPNNEIYISGGLQRGVVEQRVSVACRIDEPLLQEDTEPLPLPPGPKPVVRVSARETGPDTGSAADAAPVEAEEDPVLQASVDELPGPDKPASMPAVSELATISSPAASPAKRKSTSTSGWKWAALALLSLGAALYFETDLRELLPEQLTSPITVSREPISSQIEPLEHEATEPAPDIEVGTKLARDAEPGDAESSLNAEPAETIFEPVETVSKQEDVLPFSPADGAEPLARAPAGEELSGLDEPTVVPEVIADEHLSRARSLLADGFVTWPPEDNAVLRVQQVLASDPNNTEALRLLDEAAETLLNEAQVAYEDGFVEGALQVVDSVLGFNPGLRRAREMRAEIAGW